MTHEQFEQAAQYWNKKEKITMPEGMQTRCKRQIFPRLAKNLL